MENKIYLSQQQSRMKTFALAIFSLLLVGQAFAAPLPLQTIVNDESMQCARFLPGDECMDCMPPEGWKILGPDVPCPESYTMVTVKGDCKGFENERCCTEKHTGATGDCRNMVKNDFTKECAFVTNSITDTVTNGWQKMPEDADPSIWVCPLDYTWTALIATKPANTVQYGPINIVSAINDADFQVSSGNYVSGWTWLTQPGQSASWKFYNLPTDRRIFIYLTPLVTRPSGNSGGSGYSTDVEITYETRTGSINAKVPLKNTHPELKISADTMGWGYQTFGYLMVSADKILLDGQITVTLTKYPNAEHVAVNKECCTIEYI
jgi:hypothetical protein